MELFSDEFLPCINKVILFYSICHYTKALDVSSEWEMGGGGGG